MAETEIVGYENAKKGPEQTILFKDTTHADKYGRMTASAELDRVQKYGWFVITSRVTSGIKLLCEKKVEVGR
jgi:hypothetical protein